MKVFNHCICSNDMVTLINESAGYESLMIKYDLNDAHDLNVEWTKVSYWACG